MKSQNTKSSDELQREVRQEVRNVNRDIDNIQGRLTPGRFIDDAIFYNHSRSPAAIFDHLKRNPVGTTFLSLGTLLLMEDDTHTTYETSARNKISSGRTAVNEKISAVGSKVSALKEKAQSYIPQKDASEPGLVDRVKDSFDAKVAEIREGLEVKANRKEITETFMNADESNSEGFAGMNTGMDADVNFDINGGGKTGKLQDVKAKLTSGISQGREKFQNLDNTTFMALGAGLGILTGASLPVSEAEERMVNDKLQGKLSDFNSELREAMNECSNILKDLVISDVKNFSVKMF